MDPTDYFVHKEETERGPLFHICRLREDGEPLCHIKDDAAEDSLLDDLMIGDSQGNNVSYIHCGAIERMLDNGSAIAGLDFGEESAEGGYEVALEEKLEYVRGNDCTPSLPSMPRPEFYIWYGEGCCDDKTPDYAEARRIRRALRIDGHDAYIADADQNEIMHYELTLPGFDRGTDETDDLVIWVAAISEEEVLKAATDCSEGFRVEGYSVADIPDDCEPDFILPSQAADLRDRVDQLRGANSPTMKA